LGHMFASVYSEPAVCIHGERTYSCAAGVIPGCGGAAMLFCLDLASSLRAARCVDPAASALYMDDATSIGRNYEKLRAAVAPRALAKTVVLHKRGPGAVPAELRESWQPATRLLGAYVGDPAEASGLFAADVNAKLDKIEQCVLPAKVSAQAKWLMLRSVELGIRWKFASTKPSITASVAPSVDDRIVASVMHLCAGEATMTSMSRALIFLPIASGGLGLFPYSTHAAQLYDVASLQAQWPPQALDPEDAHAAPTNVKATTKQLYDSLITGANELVARNDLNSRSDESTPWFNVSPTMKHLRVSDDAWRLFMCNYLRCRVEYPVCGDPQFAPGSTMPVDHANCCHYCGGPYRNLRHGFVQTAFLQSCRMFGIQATSRLDDAIGKQHDEKRPDVIVYRVDRTDEGPQKPLLLDFVVAHQTTPGAENAVQRDYTKKLNKYERDVSDHFEFHPVALSTLATLHHKSLKAVESLQPQALSRGFARDCTNRMKIAIVNFEIIRYRMLSARKASGSLEDRSNVNTSAHQTTSDHAGA